MKTTRIMHLILLVLSLARAQEDEIIIQTGESKCSEGACLGYVYFRGNKVRRMCSTDDQKGPSEVLAPGQTFSCIDFYDDAYRAAA